MIMMCIRKEAEKARQSKHLPHGFCYSSCLAFLGDGLFPGNVIWNKPVLPKAPLGHAHYHSNRNLTKIEHMIGCFPHANGKIQYMNWLVWVKRSRFGAFLIKAIQTHLTSQFELPPYVPGFWKLFLESETK